MKLSKRAATSILASGILLIGGAGVATASITAGGTPGPPDRVNSANETGTIWICYKDKAAPYVQFRGEPNGCANGYTQLAMSPQNGGVAGVTQDEDGKGFTLQYLDGSTQKIKFPAAQPGQGPGDILHNSSTEVAQPGRFEVDVTCQADGGPDATGYTAISGGYTVYNDENGGENSPDNAKVQIIRHTNSQAGTPEGNGTYRIVGINNDDKAHKVAATVVCLKDPGDDPTT